ncbi:MAG: phospholipid carrier-dependent glycosyltransferase [Acidobacteria bacterium]|nr:phospholipid carrier-dependent glycosyltransferase [Acidobacteriota bacterium]MCA1638740.1 phospholipid carrier-dependent glycosyltransferase [Acidobacteriota bacterium]
MEKILIILCVLLGLAYTVLAFPDGAIAVLLVLFLTIPAIYLIRYYSEEKTFLTSIFLVALLLRLGVGLFIHLFDLRNFFGPDALAYDAGGQRLVEIWQGLPVPDDDITLRANTTTGAGWGMYYVVGFIYFIFGQSTLVAQSFCGFIGALIAPMIYFCAEKIFHNQRVAKISALSVALFPSFIIWSSQLMKDGLIIFLLVVTMTMVLQLQKKFSFSAITFLILSLFGIISLRFYIFYMVAIAAAGSFVIGLSASFQSIIRNTIAVVIIGLVLTYLGVIRTASTDFETYGSLERVQASRLDLARSAESGFGEDLDVSTREGAIAAIPIGFAYLMFAPFPWEVNKLNQALVLPEVFVWWALIPILISGLWYTLKNRLRSAIPILIFLLMLTIAYSIFQGNVGTAYRQRTQIQVFLFIFIAVGWTVIQERRENRKLLRQAKQQKVMQRLQANKANNVIS